MNHRLLSAFFAAALVASSAPALAQSTPVPSPLMTVAPSPAPTAKSTETPATPKPNPGKHLGQYKKIATGNLSLGQMTYALTHLPQEIAAARKIHKVKFSNLRVQHVPTSLKRLIHTSFAGQLVAYEPVTLDDALAQTPTPAPSSGGLLGGLLNIIANINISDALNNALNGNTVSVSLSNVLNGNKIAIGQVVGLYIGGGGIITTILK